MEDDGGRPDRDVSIGEMQFRGRVPRTLPQSDLRQSPRQVSDMATTWPSEPPFTRGSAIAYLSSLEVPKDRRRRSLQRNHPAADTVEKRGMNLPTALGASILHRATPCRANLRTLQSEPRPHDLPGPDAKDREAKNPITVGIDQHFHEAACLRKSSRAQDRLHRDLGKPIGNPLGLGIIFAYRASIHTSSASHRPRDCSFRLPCESTTI